MTKINIIVPSLGESITEGTIAKWYKKNGDFVAKDEVLLDLETEKVTLEVRAEQEGVLEEVIANAGDTVKVGQNIASIAVGANMAKDNSKNQDIKPASEIKNEVKLPQEPILSPAAQKIALENNLDLLKLQNPTGKDNRYTKADILSQSASVQEMDKNILPPALIQDSRVNRVKMSRLRQTIAQRLKDSQNTAAILTTFNEVDMTNVVQMRTKYKDEFEKRYKTKLGFMSFFVKATIAALQDIPSINAEIEGEDIVYKNYYDIGIAVGSEKGLVVPIIRDAEKLSFAEIETYIAKLGAKARENKLTIEELTGGTFSISNGGVYGSMLSTPILNPPQSGILGMHKMQDRAVVVNGQIQIRSMMYLALSYDHRIVDGKEAVVFLCKIKDAIENPERLLLDL